MVCLAEVSSTSFSLPVASSAALKTGPTVLSSPQMVLSGPMVSSPQMAGLTMQLSPQMADSDWSKQQEAQRGGKSANWHFGYAQFVNYIEYRTRSCHSQT